MKKVAVIVIIILLNINIIDAMQNLKIESAENSAHGGACNASLDTPDSLFYNPANYYGIKQNVVSFSYNKYFVGFESDVEIGASDGYYPVDVNSWHLSLITPVINMGAVGLAITSFNFAQLFTVYTFYTSYSTELNRFVDIKNKIGIGISGKYLLKEYGETVYSKDSQFYISGFSIDLGGHIILSRNFYAGISILNFLSTDAGFYAEDIDNPLYRMGVVYKVHNIENRFGFKKIDIFFDFEYISNNYNFYTGMDLYILNNFNLRMGINFDYIGIGLGYNYNKFFVIDYALNYYINDFIGTILNHKLSIRAYF